MGRRFESCRAHHDFNGSSQENGSVANKPTPLPLPLNLISSFDKKTAGVAQEAPIGSREQNAFAIGERAA